MSDESIETLVGAVVKALRDSGEACCAPITTCCCTPVVVVCSCGSCPAPESAP